VVAGWKENTPPGSIFAAQVPGVITPQKVMKDCQRELTTFLNSLELLGDRIGPLLLQFPYFNRNAFASRAQFDKLLQPFLKTLPKELQFAWRYEIKIGGFRRYRPGFQALMCSLARSISSAATSFMLVSSAIEKTAKPSAGTIWLKTKPLS